MSGFSTIFHLSSKDNLLKRLSFMPTTRQKATKIQWLFKEKCFFANCRRHFTFSNSIKLTIMQIHQEISKQIDSIQKHWQRSNGEDDRISRIDRDILINDLRKLYDLVYELKLGNVATDESIVKQNQEPAQQDQPPQKTVAPLLRENESNEAPAKPEAQAEPKENADVVTDTPRRNPEEVILEIVNSTENNEPEAVDKNEAEQEQPGQAEEIHQEESTVVSEEKIFATRRTETRISTSDKFEAPKTLADVYSKNGDNSLAAKIQKNTIADIKSAIGINDRFLFINTIFNGDAEAYRSAIDFFNAAGTYREALQLFDEIKHKYNLKDEPALARLMEIVARKF
jgi:hypothetical protein